MIGFRRGMPVMLASMAALCALVWFTSRYPVNSQVVDADTQAAEDERLWELERRAYETEIRQAEDRPSLTVFVEDAAALKDGFTPAWIVLFAEGNRLLGSYAEVVRWEEKAAYELDFKTISRKGRIHSQKVQLFDLGIGSRWSLSREKTDETLPCEEVELFLNGEDEGCYMLEQIILPEEQA